MISKTITEIDLLKAKQKAYGIELPFVDKTSLVAEIDRLKQCRETTREISVEKTINILDRCAKLWLNPSYSKKHIEILSQLTNQSPELVAQELEGCMSIFLRENVEKIISEELGSSQILDGWVKTSYGLVKREPLGVLFHNISGNAFVVIPVSILMGLVSKNSNIIKVSKDEPYFAYAVWQSLCEIDSSIKDRLSVVFFDSSSTDIYQAAVRSCSGVIHWGGAESGKIMSELCAKNNVKLISHGPKISFEVIDNMDDMIKTTYNVAKDIILWEQKACLSPRIVFINNKLDVDGFSQKLASSLRKITKNYPKLYQSPWNSIKTIQDRQYCLVKYGLKNNTQVYSSYNADFTVVSNPSLPDKEDIDKCFYRFVFVCAFSSKDEVFEYANKNLKMYLQTMGYAGADEKFIERMAALGVTIITKPGEMSLHSPGTSHDGISNLHEMTYAVSRQ